MRNKPPQGLTAATARGAEARRKRDSFVINGVKAIISGIDLADRVLVLGRSQADDEGRHRITTVLVDPAAPGIEWVDLPVGWRKGARQFQLTFTDTEAPLDALIGAEGQGRLVPWPSTHVERLMTAALCLGNARYCLSVARAPTVRSSAAG